MDLLKAVDTTTNKFDQRKGKAKIVQASPSKIRGTLMSIINIHIGKLKEAISKAINEIKDKVEDIIDDMIQEVIKPINDYILETGRSKLENYSTKSYLISTKSHDKSMINNILNRIMEGKVSNKNDIINLLHNLESKGLSDNRLGLILEGTELYIGIQKFLDSIYPYMINKF